MGTEDLFAFRLLVWYNVRSALLPSASSTVLM